MEIRSRVTGFSERLYRTLLVAYPREFRRQYSEQLVQAFGDLCHEEYEQRGKKGLLLLWMRTLGDLAVSVFSARSGIPLFSFSGVRVGGLIIMLGGVSQFVAWALFFSDIRFRFESTSQLRPVILTLSPGPTAFPLLATGLVILGIYLARRVPRSAIRARSLALVGIFMAAVSAMASAARIFIEIAVESDLPASAGPPFSIGKTVIEGPFGPEILTDSSLISALTVLAHSEYWTLAFAGMALGGVLLLSGVAGRWWVLATLLGLLAVPQVIALLRAVAWWPFLSIWYDFIIPPDLLILVPHALVAIGWMALGLLLVSRRGERLEELARAS